MLEELSQSIELSPLNQEKILRMLRMPRQADAGPQDPVFDAQLAKQVGLCEAEVRRCAHPRAVLRILPVGELGPLLEGNDIQRLLADCEEAVLMAVTLGAELEKRLMQEEVTNLSNAYVMDLCASQAVEEAADRLEGRLRERIRAEQKYLTNRFSPGYGDYPLRVQRPLLDYLNAGRAVGLTLTPTGLMVPRKSITAVMGISKAPKPEVYGSCRHCPLITKCSWRSFGERCYEQPDINIDL